MEADVCGVAPPDWPVRSIEEVCLRVTSGGTPSRSAPEYYHDGVWAWVKTQELTDGWLDDTEEHITDEAVANSAAKVLPPKTILLALYGATVGQLGLLRREMTCNQACCALIVDGNKADHRYVFYQLLHHRPQLKRLATGAAQQNLSGELIKSFRFPFPALPEQRAIAHILGSLDDKIELNRQMNETLEAMARAIFKSWFLDFDPVRAKLALSKAEGVEGRQPFGMDASTAAFFPDSFEDSPLGKIPKGWKVGTLADVAENPRRGVRPAGLLPDTPYIGLEHMPRKSIALSDWGVARNVASNKFRFCQGEILFGKLRPYFHKVGVAVQDGVCSTDIVVIGAKSSEWFGILLGHVSSEEFVNYTDAVSTGTKMPRTNWQDMARYEVPLPDSQLANAHSQFTLRIVEMIRQNILQSRTLGAIRDMLLPKLISGEIRVKDADRLLGSNQ
jgi:type I restriction enzyme S subunit